MNLRHECACVAGAQQLRRPQSSMFVLTHDLHSRDTQSHEAL
jgi:hypothetical protein